MLQENNNPHARTQSDLLAGLEPAPRQDPQGGALETSSLVEMAARLVQEGLDLQAKGREGVGLAQILRGRALLVMEAALLEEQGNVRPWARVQRLEQRLARDLQLVRLGAAGFAVRPLDLSVEVSAQDAAKLWRARGAGWML